MKCVLFIISLGLAYSHDTQGFTGNVATPLGQIVNVQLDPFVGSDFENNFVKLTGIPDETLPDKYDCYCFSADDPRFATVHAYYHASKQLLELHKLLANHKLAAPPQIRISLKTTSGLEPSGSASGGSITLRIGRPDFDISLLAHEIGHEVQFAITGKTPIQLLEIGNAKEMALWADSEWNKYALRAGSLEGAANLLASFYTGHSEIGKLDWHEAAIDIQTLVVFPILVPTVRSGLQRRLNSVRYSAAYPRSLETVEQLLKNPSFPKLLDQPDPYLASAAINAPLWQAGQLFGKELLLGLFLRSLSEFKPVGSYANFAEILMRNSQSFFPLHAYLSREYKARGLTRVSPGG